MKNPLHKRLIRDFRSNLGRYLCILLLVIATITFGSSFLVVTDGITYTLNQNQKDSRIEDGEFQTATLLDSHIEDMIRENDFELEHAFYVEASKFDKDATLRIYEERQEINKPSVFEGSLPNHKQEIAVDRSFATNHNLSVGDMVSANGKEWKVCGIISLPDYNSLFKENTDMVMNPLTFGVALVSKEGFERWNETEYKYNYVYRFMKRNLTDQEKREEGLKLAGVLSQVSELNSFIHAQDNQRISFLGDDLGSDVPMMKVLLLIILIIVAFVFAILSKHTVEQEAAIIGTLRASGYRKSEIIRHYLTMPIAVTLVGAIIGNVLGYTVVIRPFQNVYYASYSLSPFQYRFSLEALILTTIVPIIIMLVVNAVILGRKLSLSPLKFLRKDLSVHHNRHAKKLPNISFSKRFRLRVILQNRGNYMILFIGIVFASILLLFGVGLMPMIDNYVDTVGDSMPCEYQYILKTPIQHSEGEEITTLSTKMYDDLMDDDINITMIGVPDNSKYLDYIKLPVKTNHVILSDAMSKRMGLMKGDSFVVCNPYTDKKYHLVVAGIVKYRTNLAAFIGQEQLNELMNYERTYYNTLYSKKPLELPAEAVIKEITSKDYESVADQMTTTFSGMCNIIIVFSVAIYLILMYLLTKLVIDRNRTSISFMKVFGYRDQEVGKLYLHTTTWVVLGSLILTIPLELLAMKGLMKFAFAKIEGYLELYIPLWVVLVTFATGVASYLVINAIHVRRLRRVSLGEALKNRE